MGICLLKISETVVCHGRFLAPFLQLQVGHPGSKVRVALSAVSEAPGRGQSWIFIFVGYVKEGLRLHSEQGGDGRPPPHICSSLVANPYPLPKTLMENDWSANLLPSPLITSNLKTKLPPGSPGPWLYSICPIK